MFHCFIFNYNQTLYKHVYTITSINMDRFIKDRKNEFTIDTETRFA